MTTGRLQALAVLVGGALGALARAALAEAIPHGAGDWPWATFAANMAGTLLLAGVTVRLSAIVAPARYWRLLIGTGFCGALTTFSTLQVETIELARDGHAGTAAAYALASIAAGLAVAVAGAIVARRRRYE